MKVHTVRGREPGPVAALVAGIHGDEYEGPTALWALLEQIDPDRLRGTLRVVPVAHEAAFLAGTRESPVDGANLARVFPGDPAGSPTLRLAAKLFDTVVRGADLLVDLHSGGARLAFMQVAGFYAEDPRSLALARSMRLPRLWRMPARDGVLSREATRIGVAATGCEAGGRGGCAAEDTEAYLRGVRGVLADAGLIDGDGSAPNDDTTALDGDFALARADGYLEPLVSLGDRVAAGTPLARLRALDGTVTELLAEVDGVVMAERHLRSIRTGEWATCAVREVSL